MLFEGNFPFLTTNRLYLRQIQPTDTEALSQLTPGLVIQPGQSVSIEFDHAGSYYITSKNTPHMNLKIIVTGPNKKGGDY